VEAHSNETTSALAEKLGVTPRTLRRYKEELGLISPVNQYDNDAHRIATFRKFLIKGRTEKELRKKFKEHTDTLLAGDYGGLVLFTQRDRYRQKVYVLLPKYDPKEIVLKDRDHEVTVAEEDPFVSILLPDFQEEIIIAPLFDVHYGHHAHRHEKFLAYLRWIEETPNVYAILGGDLCENALDDSRGMTYDQVETPHTQLDRMTELLAPIAHKCLCSTTGNHEQRTERKTNIDVSRILAERLKVPYFDGPIFLSVNANTFTWNFYVFHGKGNSQTKGGKMNMAGRARRFTDNVHFFISGHVHDAVAEPETTIVMTPEGLIYETQWIVVCQSFLGWKNTYAYRSAYSPPSKGGVSLVLKADGDYRASLT